MLSKLIILVISLIYTNCCLSQNNLPVIKASSRNVDIRDGSHFKKSYWYIMPEKKPDYYFTEIPHRRHTVVFITDVDSISFQIEYDREYEFIVLLNNKDSCYTRIVARERNLIGYNTGLSTNGRDTIPFTIGNNSKIYLKGSINNSGSLDIQFDLGSGGCILKKSSVKKVNMVFDDSVTLTNSDGTNLVPLSRNNILQIANLAWDSVEFAVANNMTRREDMIIGNILFLNKIVEINYDKKIMIIHDSIPPGITDGYSGHDLILDGGVVPYIEASLSFRSKTKRGWFLFDTGAYTSILNSNDIPASNKMIHEAGKMMGMGSKTNAPGLAIGKYGFTDFNYTTQKQDRSDMVGILGNDILKRFNIILDNRNGQIYLKPNSLAGETYSNPEYYLVRIVAIFLTIMLTLALYMRYRKGRKLYKSSPCPASFQHSGIRSLEFT